MNLSLIDTKQAMTSQDHNVIKYRHMAPSLLRHLSNHLGLVILVVLLRQANRAVQGVQEVHKLRHHPTTNISNNSMDGKTQKLELLTGYPQPEGLFKVPATQMKSGHITFKPMLLPHLYTRVVRYTFN